MNESPRADKSDTKHGTRYTYRWLPLALLALPSLILYWPFLLGGKTLYWGTALLQFWPWRRFAVQELLAGRLPLWNPYAGSGVPLLADHQSAVFYPLNVLYLLLPVERAMGVSLALHAVLAAVALYALLRAWGVSRLGGAIGGLAFSLSGYMVARGSFLTEISALPWLPLMWLYAGRLLRRREMAKAVPTDPVAEGRSGRSLDRARDVLALALVIAVQFLAGHAQTWFYSLCTLLLYAAWETLSRLRRTRARPPVPQSPVRPAAGTLLPTPLPLLAALLWGLALSAAQFLPTLELSLLARRAQDAGWERYALQYSMWPWRLITLLLPDFFGNPARGNYWGYATYWEDAGYIGVLPFVLAVGAIVAWARRRATGKRTEDAPQPAQAPAPDVLSRVPFLAALALFALLMALGKNTPFYLFFFRYVPGFGSFQAPARWLGMYTAAMAALAGVGADALPALRRRRLGVFCRLGVVGGASMGLAAFLGRAYLPGTMDTFADALIRFAVPWIGAMLALLWGRSATTADRRSTSRAIRTNRRSSSRAIRTDRRSASRLRYVGWTAAVLLVVAVDLIWAGYGLNPAIDAALYKPRTETGAALAADGPQGRTFLSAKTLDEVLYGQYLDFGDYFPNADGTPAIEHWWGLREALLPDLGMVERLPSANTFEPLIEARTRTLLETVNDMPRPLAERTLGTMNVAYLLDPSPGERDDVVHRSPTIAAIRNPRLLPRAYVVHQIRHADSPDHALALLSAPDFDPSQEVVLEGQVRREYGVGSIEYAARDTQHATRNAQHVPATSRRPQAGQATLLPSPPNQVTIRAVLPQPGVLVLADTAYPGWQATIEGHTTEIYRANYAYRAVILDVGTHEVIFRYRPLSFLCGAVVSAIASVGALVVAILRWTKRAARENG